MLSLALCGGMLSTVREMPRAAVNAAEQARGIESRVNPVEMWNQNHLADMQEEQAAQDANAIVETGTWDLLVIQAQGILRIAWRVVGVAIAVSALVAALGLGAMAAVGVFAVVVALCCYAWERYKRARVFEPWQQLPNHGILYPRLGMVGNTLTGEGWKMTTERPASVDGGKLLIAARKPSLNEVLIAWLTKRPIVIPRYRFAALGGQRHPETQREVIEG